MQYRFNSRTSHCGHLWNKDVFYRVDTGLGRNNCYTVYKSTSEIWTPLYTGHFLWSQGCPEQTSATGSQEKKNWGEGRRGGGGGGGRGCWCFNPLVTYDIQEVVIILVVGPWYTLQTLRGGNRWSRQCATCLRGIWHWSRHYLVSLCMWRGGGGGGGELWQCNSIDYIIYVHVVGHGAGGYQVCVCVCVWEGEILCLRGCYDEYASFSSSASVHFS